MAYYPTATDSITRSPNYTIISGALKLAQKEVQRHAATTTYEIHPKFDARPLVSYATYNATTITVTPPIDLGMLTKTREREHWLRDVLKHDKKDFYQAMSMAFDRIDDLLHEGDFSEVDQILAALEAKNATTELLISILTSTIGARTKLRTRGRFYKITTQLAHERGEWEDGLLDGLE